MKWIFASLGLILVAAPALAWHLMPAIALEDPRVAHDDVPTDRPFAAVERWSVACELPLGRLAYRADASIPITISGKSGAERAPVELGLDVLVNGARAAHRNATIGSDDGIAHLTWPGDIDPSGLRAGRDRIEFALSIEGAGGSVMPGWWTIEAGPADLVVRPR